MNIHAVMKNLFTFVTTHRWFTLFLIASFALNLYLTLHRDNTSEEFITCSSFDRGPLGTFGLFKSLEDAGVSVRRIELPVFRVLDNKTEKRKTLVILSPLYKPQPWEWTILMDWVAQGNRLVTAGLYGISQNGWFATAGSGITSSYVNGGPTTVLLPVDSLAGFPDTLPAVPQLNKFISGGTVYRTEGRMPIMHFTRFSPDALPFLAQGNKVTAIKKLIGRGEWVLFTDVNPFSNFTLRDSTWFTFATRFFCGDGRYSGNPILFDEFHNGYKATKSLWQLLTYFQFDTGLIYLGILVLLYLFITGIRITSPGEPRTELHRDPIPGLRALSGLFMRYGAWRGMLQKEAAHIRSELSRHHRRDADIDWLVDRYASRRKLPPGIDTKENLVRLFERIEQRADTLHKDESIALFNIFMFMRKEMKS